MAVFTILHYIVSHISEKYKLFFCYASVMRAYGDLHIENRHCKPKSAVAKSFGSRLLYYRAMTNRQIGFPIAVNFRSYSVITLPSSWSL